MAPRDTPKTTPKVQRKIVKTNKAKPSPASTLKKIMSAKNTQEKNQIQDNNTSIKSRIRTNTVPKISTPKPKENKPLQTPGNVTKSAKKTTWNRRPKPAHSGVPVPEKMKKLLEKQFQDSDYVL